MLRAIGQVVVSHTQWRELHRERDRLRDVYDRTFQFQGTVLPDGTLVDTNETLLALLMLLNSASAGSFAKRVLAINNPLSG